MVYFRLILYRNPFHSIPWLIYSLGCSTPKFSSSNVKGICKKRINDSEDNGNAL